MKDKTRDFKNQAIYTLKQLRFKLKENIKLKVFFYLKETHVVFFNYLICCAIIDLQTNRNWA